MSSEERLARAGRTCEDECLATPRVLRHAGGVLVEVREPRDKVQELLVRERREWSPFGVVEWAVLLAPRVVCLLVAHEERGHETVNVREPLDCKRIVPRADRRVLTVHLRAVGELGERLRSHIGETDDRLADGDERRVEDRSHTVHVDPAGRAVEDGGDVVHGVLARDRIQHLVDLRELLSLRGFRGEPRLLHEVTTENLLGALLVVRDGIVAEEPPVLVLAVAIRGVLKERGHRLRRVLLAELSAEERPPRLEAVVVRGIDANAVLNDLRASRVVGGRIPESDAPRTNGEVGWRLVWPLTLLDLLGDNLDVDVDDIGDDVAGRGLEQSEVPRHDLGVRDTGVLGEDVPLPADVHDLRDLLARRVVADTPVGGLHLLGDDGEELVGVRVACHRDRALEQPHEVQLARLRQAPPRGLVPRLPLALQRVDEVRREHAIVVSEESVEERGLVPGAHAVVLVLPLRQHE